MNDSYDLAQSDAPESFPMVVAFCDLKGSTQALRCLGPKDFHELQKIFFSGCSKAVDNANPNRKQLPPEDPFRKGFKETEYPKILARIDKFMGDCTMLYVRCLPGSNPPVESMQTAARMAVGIVSEIVQGVDDLADDPRLREAGVALGSRIGLASGGSVSLGKLGEQGRPGYSYTLTGEVVNLAARLEHATAAEFLSCVADARSQLVNYAKHVSKEDHLHGTSLGEELIKSDRQAVDLFAVCEQRFQIRANDHFVHLLEKGDRPIKLRWRQVPFSPQGFEGRRTAYLLGGNSLSDLLRMV